MGLRLATSLNWPSGCPSFRLGRPSIRSARPITSSAYMKFYENGLLGILDHLALASRIVNVPIALDRHMWPHAQKKKD